MADVSFCLSVANKCAMTIGVINFRNILKMLESMTIPANVSIERLAAMIVQAANSPVSESPLTR